MLEDSCIMYKDSTKNRINEQYVRLIEQREIHIGDIFEYSSSSGKRCQARINSVSFDDFGFPFCVEIMSAEDRKRIEDEYSYAQKKNFLLDEKYFVPDFTMQVELKWFEERDAKLVK